MRIFSLKTLVLASFASCAAAAFAANPARVDVPFTFSAHGQSFPAGSYRVTLDEQQNIVTLASQNEPRKRISCVVGGAESKHVLATLVFDETGGSYALKTIQYGARVTPNLHAVPNRGISATTSIAGQ